MSAALAEFWARWVALPCYIESPDVCSPISETTQLALGPCTAGFGCESELQEKTSSTGGPRLYARPHLALQTRSTHCLHCGRVCLETEVTHRCNGGKAKTPANPTTSSSDISARQLSYDRSHLHDCFLPCARDVSDVKLADGGDRHRSQ